jgi:STE24 endopeptidase
MCALRLWLAQRQISHVIAHRATYPRASPTASNSSAPESRRLYREPHPLRQNRPGRRGRAAARLDARRRPAGAARLLVARLDGLPYGVALIFSVLADFGHRRSAAQPLSPVRHRRRIRLQPHDPQLFLADLLKQAALGLVIGTPVLLAVLWLMERMGSLWWLYVWLFWCAFNLLLLFLYPTWIAPLFNKFVAARRRASSKRASKRCWRAAASPVRASS